MKRAQVLALALLSCLTLIVWQIKVTGQEQQARPERPGPPVDPGKKPDEPGIGPDLVVYSITAPPSVTRGSSMNVGDVITNRSGLYSAGQSTACLYLNTTPTITGAANLGTHNTVGISPKKSVSWSGSVTVPSNHPTGQNYYIVVTDCLNAVNEDNENNNTNSVPITVN